MIQRSQEFSFTFKPSQSVSVLSELFRKSLNGNFTAEFGIPCTAHFSHAAFTKGRHDFVVAELGARFHCLNKTTSGISRQSNSHMEA